MEIQEIQLDNYEDKSERQWNGSSNLVYDTNRPTHTKGKQKYR